MFALQPASDGGGLNETTVSSASEVDGLMTVRELFDSKVSSHAVAWPFEVHSAPCMCEEPLR